MLQLPSATPLAPKAAPDGFSALWGMVFRVLVRREQVAAPSRFTGEAHLKVGGAVLFAL